MFVAKLFQWQDWQSCSVTCEDGVETRIRTCDGCDKKTSLEENRACSNVEKCPS